MITLFSLYMVGSEEISAGNRVGSRNCVFLLFHIFIDRTVASASVAYIGSLKGEAKGEGEAEAEAIMAQWPP